MKNQNENPVLSDFPNPRSNVFFMMRFRDTAQNQSITEAISSVLKEYSLNPIRADWKQYHDELWANVRVCMDASLYGIAVFDQIDQRDINPNVSLELGYMLAQEKRCLLLKEKRVQSLQSDLVGHLYREFDSYNIKETVQAEVKHWLADLGIAKRAGERLLAYVSLGGTCRCAMAKVITQQLLKNRSLGFKLRIESIAHGFNSAPEASFGARQTIQQIFGDDLLANHRVITRSPTIMEEADLILVMDHSLLKGLPPEKTYVLKPFLGLEGDVVDPWPDDRDAAAAVRYSKCGEELKEIITAKIERIINALR